MPCHLCAERSEDYPFPARYKTPFMATAFPDFNPDTDFLCPKCYSVYFRIIECKYGPRARGRTSSSHGSSTSDGTAPTSPRLRPGEAPALMSASMRNSISDFDLSGAIGRPQNSAAIAPAFTEWRPNSLFDIPSNIRFRPSAAEIMATINRWRFPPPAVPEFVHDRDNEENASKRMRETI